MLSWQTLSISFLLEMTIAIIISLAMYVSLEVGVFKRGG